MTDRSARGESATPEVQAQVRQAMDAIDGLNGRVINGFGVHVDVSRQRLKLIEARDSIAAALRVMSDMPWPTSADYDGA